MFTVIIFVAILGLLVLAHEFGHFIAARKSGMRVYEFGFGFPPRLVGVRFLANGKREWVWGNRDVVNCHSEAEPKNPLANEKRSFACAQDDNVKVSTLYSINWLPLGGFVRIKGENGDSESEADSFMAKPVWKKTIVLAAGVVMNIVLAAVLLSIGYMVGLPQTTDNVTDATVIKEARLAIMQTVPGKPAALAELKLGDEIIQIDDIKNPRVAAMQEYVDSHRDQAITFTIARGQEILVKPITPVLSAETGKGGIGVSIAEVGLVKYPWYRAIYHGVVATGSYLVAIVIAFWQLFAGLFAGQGAASAVAGPVGIAVMTGQVARLGLAYLLQFIAMLSLNLAVINILPIPALDGGRILFTWLGKIFKKPAFMKFEQAAHSIGFALLMLLIVVVTVKDLGSLKGSFAGLINKIF